MMIMIISYVLLFQMSSFLSIGIACSLYVLLKYLCSVKAETWHSLFYEGSRWKVILPLFLLETLSQAIMLPISYWWFGYLQSTYRLELTLSLLLLSLASVFFKIKAIRKFSFKQEVSSDDHTIYQ